MINKFCIEYDQLFLRNVYRNIGVCSYSVLTSFLDRSEPFTLPSRCDAAHYEPDAIILYWLTHSWKFARIIFLAYIQHAMTLQFSLYDFIKIPRNLRLHERILEKAIYLCHPAPAPPFCKKINKQQRSQNKTQMSVCVEKWMEIDNYVML